MTNGELKAQMNQACSALGVKVKNGPCDTTQYTHLCSKIIEDNEVKLAMKHYLKSTDATIITDMENTCDGEFKKIK